MVKRKDMLLEPEEKKQAPQWLTPWEKGKSGNPKGRPKGSRNKAKELAEALIGTNATNIVKKVISMALAGNESCLKMCMDRILPSQRAIDTSSFEKMSPNINIVVESAHQISEIKQQENTIDITPIVEEIKSEQNSNIH